MDVLARPSGCAVGPVAAREVGITGLCCFSEAEWRARLGSAADAEGCRRGLADQECGLVWWALVSAAWRAGSGRPGAAWPGERGLAWQVRASAAWRAGSGGLGEAWLVERGLAWRVRGSVAGRAPWCAGSGGPGAAWPVKRGLVWRVLASAAWSGGPGRARPGGSGLENAVWRTQRAVWRTRRGLADLASRLPPGGPARTVQGLQVRLGLAGPGEPGLAWRDPPGDRGLEGSARAA